MKKLFCTLLVLAILVMISGFDIYSNAFNAAIHKNVNMDTLISMGSLASFFYSLYCNIVK